MLAIDQRALKAAWTVFLFALLVALAYLARRTVVVFALALFLAHLIGPVIDWIQRFAPRRASRTAVLTVVYLALLALAVATLIPVGATIGAQAAGLASKLPDTLKLDPFVEVPLPGWLEDLRPRITEMLRQRMAELDRDVFPMLSTAGQSILSGVGNLLALILVPILSFFFLKDGTAIRNAIVASAGSRQRAVVDDILNDLHRLLAQYIRALVLLATATFFSHILFFSMADVPYPALLAGIAAMLEFIPVVGPLSAGAIVLLVAAFAGYPHLLWILAFLVLYRVFQDYVLNPYLMSSGVDIHPLLVLFGVLAGEEAAGIPGMFFSVPVIAALRVIVLRVWKARVY
jgi:predicted PurR-regulated permease PerM